MPLELPQGWTSLPAPDGLNLTRKWEVVKDARLPQKYAAGNSGIAVEMARTLVKYKSEPASLDDWQFPADSLRLGHGDCEDWALFVRALLINGGISPSKLWLLIVRDLAVQDDHALLWTPIRYCDCRAPKPLVHAVFSDYRPIAAFRTHSDGTTEAVTFGRRAD